MKYIQKFNEEDNKFTSLGSYHTIRNFFNHILTDIMEAFISFDDSKYLHFISFGYYSKPDNYVNLGYINSLNIESFVEYIMNCQTGKNQHNGYMMDAPYVICLGLKIPSSDDNNISLFNNIELFNEIVSAINRIKDSNINIDYIGMNLDKPGQNNYKPIDIIFLFDRAKIKLMCDEASKKFFG